MINSIKWTAATLAVLVMVFTLLLAIPASAEKSKATLTKDGKLLGPAGRREWVFVGSPVTPDSLNDAAVPFPHEGKGEAK